ncbi:MAG TPA: TldD/PmbA family protein [Candidatus Limnocylindrales bacterium]|nr:TldD/PmbA family protein [Candidatus Limnocylindrales bacterium]
MDNRLQAKMLGKDKALDILTNIVRKSEADQTEAVLVGNSEGLTRFGESVIHQSMIESNIRVIFRVALGKKLGIASVNSLNPEDLKKSLQSAIQIAQLQKENPYFESFPASEEMPDLQTYYPETAAYSPQQRAEIIQQAIQRADSYGFRVAGALATGEGEMAVVNSRGLSVYQPYTQVRFNITALTADGSGYATDTSRNIQQVDFPQLIETALEKCSNSRNPSSLEPGFYDVILEPPAVSILLQWMGYIGFGAKSFQEGRSFLSGRLGERITGSSITIYDDGWDPAGVPITFDAEGVRKKKVILIDKGVAANVLYDTLTGARDHKPSTGHAMLSGGFHGGEPAPLNLFMEPGEVSFSEMLTSMERGLLITRFHYVNGLLDTRRALMTGMTRDGTFLVEEGKIKKPIQNLRFTEGILDAFSRVKKISRERHRVGFWGSEIGTCVVPALLIQGFHFTGKTSA